MIKAPRLAPCSCSGIIHLLRPTRLDDFTECTDINNSLFKLYLYTFRPETCVRLKQQNVLPKHIATQPGMSRLQSARPDPLHPHTRSCFAGWRQATRLRHALTDSFANSQSPSSAHGALQAVAYL